MSAAARRVPVRYFTLLRDALRQQGVDTDQLLRLAGIDPQRLEQREASLLPFEVEAFLGAARRLSGRTDLGFEAGRAIKLTSHGLLGFGMLSCRTFDEAMRLVMRHYHLMTETVAMRYRRAGARGEAVYTPLFDMPLETLRFYLETLAVAHHNQVRLLLGAELPAYDIYVSMPEPPHVVRYLSLAPARFHFDEGGLPGVRALMGADLLDRPLPMADPRVVEDVDARCGALGQRSPAAGVGWGEYVSMMLRQAHGELVTLDDLARRINVSARTIDRRLRKENLQFRDLSQQVRFERACELLAEPGSTVAQVALGLGFSDTANFSRAFRRVVGVSPSVYQQRASAAAASAA